MGTWEMSFEQPSNDKPWKFIADYPGGPGPFWLVEHFAGRVISNGEMNGYDDSDFYAVIWNDDCIIRHTYATTRGWTYPNYCKDDAIPEVIAAREACDKRDRAVAAYDQTRRTYANVAIIGRRVKVTKGRKVPQGTEGYVTWSAPDRFQRPSRYYIPGVPREETKYRVGIRDECGETHFTAASNCVVIMDDGMMNDLELCAGEAYEAHLAALWACAVAKDALETFAAKRAEEWRKDLPVAQEAERAGREMLARKAAEKAAQEAMKPETPAVQ